VVLLGLLLAGVLADALICNVHIGTAEVLACRIAVLHVVIRVVLQATGSKDSAAPTFAMS
jgi:hypothetical protein